MKVMFDFPDEIQCAFVSVIVDGKNQYFAKTASYNTDNLYDGAEIKYGVITDDDD